MIHLGGCEWYQIGCVLNEQLQDLERTVFRPVGEDVKQWERDNRESIQAVGNVALEIVRESGSDILTYMGTGQFPPGDIYATGGAPGGAFGGLPPWALPAAAGVVLLLLVL